MQTTMLEQLQQRCLDNRCTTKDLLRHALVIAKKLDLTDFTQFLQNELGGYSDLIKIPSYRKIPCQLKYKNNIKKTWEIIRFDDEKIEESYSKTEIYQSISELEDILEKKDGFLMIRLSPKNEKILRQAYNSVFFMSEFGLIIESSHIRGIIENIRNLILNWALDLEKAGVHGQEIRFTKEEEKIAREVSITYQLNADTINLVTGSSGTQITNRSSDTQQTITSDEKVVEKITALLSRIMSTASQFPPSDIISKEIENIKNQINSHKPQENLIRGSLNSLKSIFENMTGELAANYVRELGFFLSLANLLA